MPRCPLTTTYILHMVANHGSKTFKVLKGYGRDEIEILDAYDRIHKEGYLEPGKNAKKPYLTEVGMRHLQNYFGNDINGYDE